MCDRVKPIDMGRRVDRHTFLLYVLTVIKFIIIIIIGASFIYMRRARITILCFYMYSTIILLWHYACVTGLSVSRCQMM